MTDKEYNLDIGYSVYGDDDNFSMLSRESNIGIDPVVIGRGSPSNFQEVCGMGEHLPFQDSSISSVWAGHCFYDYKGKGYPTDEPLEYGDLTDGIVEIARVLKPGGKVFLRINYDEGSKAIRLLKSYGFVIDVDNTYFEGPGDEGDEWYIHARKVK